MKRILLHLDPDPHPSLFDRVVALDAGADEVLSYGGVTPEDAVALAHGAIFTRGPKDLHNTAIFVGGSDAARAEAVRDAVLGAFFGPLRVSVLCDPNGANTTAAAAILACGVACECEEEDVAVLGLGPVGSRVAALVRDGGGAPRTFDPTRESTAGSVAEAVAGARTAFACGPAGTALTTLDALRTAGVRVAVDLNAVPPAGIAGLAPGDDGADRDGVRGFGALAVGRLKMKIHRAAVRSLFEANDRVLGAAECLALGRGSAGPGLVGNSSGA